MTEARAVPSTADDAAPAVSAASPAAVQGTPQRLASIAYVNTACGPTCNIDSEDPDVVLEVPEGPTELTSATLTFDFEYRTEARADFYAEVVSTPARRVVPRTVALPRSAAWTPARTQQRVEGLVPGQTYELWFYGISDILPVKQSFINLRDVTVSVEHAEQNGGAS